MSSGGPSAAPMRAWAWGNGRLSRPLDLATFSAEFAAATTVLVCSKLGLPISTTHTLVGAVIGVGLARGLAALDPRVMRGTVSAWVVTWPASCGLAAVIYWTLHQLFLG